MAETVPLLFDGRDLTDVRLAAIERALAELVRLGEARDEREGLFYDQAQALIGPALELESFLVQLYTICRTQNQGFMALTDALRLWLAYVQASDRAAEQERAAGVG